MRLQTLSNLLKSDTANLRLRLDCIAAALQEREYAVAVDLADEGLTYVPGSAELEFSKVNGLIGCRDYGRAIELLSLLQAADPQNVAVGQNLSLCYYCLNDYGNARNHAESVYAVGVRDAGLVRLLVSSCHHLGLMDRATEVADENYELARTDSALAGVYSLVYLDVSRSGEAARCAAYALRSNPNCVDALVSDATLRIAAGDVDRARQEFEQVLALNPKAGRAWVGLGSLALLRQDFDQAKADLSRGLEFMPGHVGSWHMLGWTHLVAGNLDEAERIFQHAMELDRNFAETHGALAAIAAMRGNTEQAEESIRVALRLDADSLAARFAQSVLASRSGDAARSQQILQGALTQLFAGNAAGVTKLIASVKQPQRK